MPTACVSRSNRINVRCIVLRRDVVACGIVRRFVDRERGRRLYYLLLIHKTRSYLFDIVFYFVIIIIATRIYDF